MKQTSSEKVFTICNIVDWFQKGVCRYEFGADGNNKSLISLPDKTNYAIVSSFMTIGLDEQTWDSSAIEKVDDVLKIFFSDSDVKVTVRILSRSEYFTIEILDVTGPAIDWLQISQLKVTVDQNEGKLINAAWDASFGVCVLACNDLVDCGSHGILSARAYKEFGFKNAKVAVIGVTSNSKPVPERLLDVIERVELEQGLPHIIVNGKWIKRDPERLGSYLMLNASLTEENVDQVIEFAKMGGFRVVEFFPFASTPSYTINRETFPNGLDGLKQTVAKMHAAGLRAGLHVFQGMPWGDLNQELYLTPSLDSRFLQDRHAVLAAPLASTDTEIHVEEATDGWPDKGRLFLEGEVVGYKKKLNHGFTDCTRGIHSTRIGNYAKGTRLGYLVNSWDFLGNYKYAPDIKTTLFDEIRDNIVNVFDETKADMTYLDAGEEWRKQPPAWRNVGRMALEIQQKLKKKIVLGGNNVYTHLAWHVVSRGSPSNDPLFYGRREYTLQYKGQNPARWTKNLLTGDVGWFDPCASSLFSDAVTPDEIMLLCLKAVAGKAPVSIAVSAKNLWKNKRMPEMLEIIRACEELKQRNYFSDSACKELSRPMAEHILEQTSKEEWNIRPIQWGPPVLVTGASFSSKPALQTEKKPSHFTNHKVKSSWNIHNPFASQRPMIRIRARSWLASYGSKDNIVLTDFSEKVMFKPNGSSSSSLIQTIESSTEKTPAGSSAFRYCAINQGDTTSDWCRISLPFSKPFDLEHYRRLGIWLHASDSGGILNVQLKAGVAHRDHYIDLNFTGWSYFELDPPEKKRFYDYRWPYVMKSLFEQRFKYASVDGINLYYNALSPHSKTVCLIGRIEALQECSYELKNPTLETDHQSIIFPVSLKPDDYLELDWHGVGRLFEPDGGLLSDIKPVGNFTFSPGNNRINFRCETNGNYTPRAEVTLVLRGDQIPDVKEKGSSIPAGSSDIKANSTASYPSLSAVPTAETRKIRKLPDGKGGFRIMQGVYERIHRGINLPTAWKFKKDPLDKGIDDKWFATPVNASWESIMIDKGWPAQGHDYYGAAWYAVTFQAPVEFRGTQPIIRFSAVDGVADIFLDGVKIGEQKKKPSIMWDQPFQVSLPANFNFSTVHDLIVRVKKDADQAGIWKPVAICPTIILDEEIK